MPYSSGRPQCFSAPHPSEEDGDNYPSTSYRRNDTSAVVNEVENIRQSRIERRAQQDIQRMQLSRLRNKDPNNPNWEFCHLIRQALAQQEQGYSPLTPDSYAFGVLDVPIRVCVRKRPLNNRELKLRDLDVVTIPNPTSVLVHEPKTKVNLTKYLDNHRFYFDCTFDGLSTNEMVYKMTAQPLVRTIFNGGMATCFAYGQTGSGKTHTMGGDFTGKSQNCQTGIYAMAASDVFMLMESPQAVAKGLRVCCSFFEIYGTKLFDLLNKKNRLSVMEDARQQIVVVGLKEKPVESVSDVLKLIQIGSAARTSGKTSVNACSSRSHAVFQINLRLPNGELYGKFSFIDLAGNERGTDTANSDKETRIEGAEINKSLLALKECIRALGLKGAHLPFRASKLTQVLRDSFIGENSRTCMIAMISPGMSSCDNSLNTLRYADRVKELGADSSEDTGAAASSRSATPTPTRPSSPVDVEEEDEEANGAENQDTENNNDDPSPGREFHKKASELERAEDRIVQAHKAMLGRYTDWALIDQRLVAMRTNPDYTTDQYMDLLERFLKEKISIMQGIRGKVERYRSLTDNEDTASTIMSTTTLHIELQDPAPAGASRSPEVRGYARESSRGRAQTPPPQSSGYGPAQLLREYYNNGRRAATAAPRVQSPSPVTGVRLQRRPLTPASKSNRPQFR